MTVFFLSLHLTAIIVLSIGAGLAYYKSYAFLLAFNVFWLAFNIYHAIRHVLTLIEGMS